MAVDVPGFRDYIPEEWFDNVRVDREFFWDILCTLAYDFVDALIEDCRVQRAALRL